MMGIMSAFYDIIYRHRMAVVIQKDIIFLVWVEPKSYDSGILHARNWYMSENLSSVRSCKFGFPEEGQPWPAISVSVVFGGICRETKEFFLVLVKNRSRKTLLPLIRNQVRPGSIVVSDGWRAYQGLSAEGYQHMSVNQSVNFVDKDTKARTKTVQSRWSQVKKSNKLRCGAHRMLQSYLAEYVWRRRLASGEDPFERLLRDIAAGGRPNDLRIFEVVLS
ncbi:hypothetical protein M514_21628 [Trichuris suis]|uniref:ISXO2-like transposase domain-containing protein n=1 Tax=Trichuris suis TaxID=68888 RepID=A0A085N9G8_9BILA|nr:hypothetical protein M514_21628 [Trichuris suis]